MDEFEAIQGARAGYREAFDFLVRLYHRRLYYYVVGKIAANDEAEDIVQKTFVTAFTEFHSFDPRQSLIAWLRGIALNHCRNSWRSHGRRARAEQRLLEIRRAELELGRLESPYCDDDRPIRALRACMGNLDESEQKVVRQRFVEEASLQLIGGQLGKSAEAARLFLFRLRMKLLACVKKRLARGEAI